MTHESRSPTLPCPERYVLVAFRKGDLPIAQLKDVAEHLGTCVPCEETLQNMEEAPTMLRLRSALEADPLLAEPEYRALEERAKALPLDGSNFTVSVGSARPIVEWQGPRSFAGFDLLEKIGQGGMGVVFKARQRTLHRIVAVKMLLPARQTDSEAMTRMCIEGEAVARLRHPNVVPVYDLAEYEGQLYLVMEYLEGGNLAARFTRGVLPEREAASLVGALASAVHAAHEAGIVHRDLKPGNVLLAADGTPKVTDFGLARLLDDPEGANTRTEAILGTPTYMAPEQARGASREVGPAADVYALGVVLYEALTGRPPFKGKSRMQTLDLVQRTEPLPPRRLRPGLSADLEAVCLKCLEKDPRRRYTAAEDMAADLHRFLQGSPTAARPLTRPARALRAIRRHPGWAAAAIFALLLAAMVPVARTRLDPDRPGGEIEVALARGEQVVLVGDKGGPRWSRWVIGGDGRSTHASTNGPFVVSSWSFDMLELVSDPQMDRYRLSALVKQDAGETTPTVGLYFGHRLYTTSSGGRIRFFGALTFNDITDPQQVFLSTPHGEKAPMPPKLTASQLAPHLLPEVPWPSDWGCCGDHVESALFEPAGMHGGPWHEIAIEVTPEEVRGFWDGKKIGTIRAASFVRSSLEQLGQPIRLPALGFDPNLVELEYAPRGSLGLYVNHSSASFTNVVFGPLAGPD